MRMLYKENSACGYIVEDEHVEALTNADFLMLPVNTIKNTVTLSDAKVKTLLSAIEEIEELMKEPAKKDTKKGTKKGTKGKSNVKR